jgi:hypothetical protein
VATVDSRGRLYGNRPSQIGDCFALLAFVVIWYDLSREAQWFAQVMLGRCFDLDFKASLLRVAAVWPTTSVGAYSTYAFSHIHMFRGNWSKMKLHNETEQKWSAS